MKFIAEWGMIAGIAGLGLGVFLMLFREVIRKNIFASLTKKQSFRILIIFHVTGLVGVHLFHLSIYQGTK